MRWSLRVKTIFLLSNTIITTVFSPFRPLRLEHIHHFPAGTAPSVSSRGQETNTIINCEFNNKHIMNHSAKISEKDLGYLLSLCITQAKRNLVEKIRDCAMDYPDLFDYLQEQRLLKTLPSPNSSLFSNPGAENDDHSPVTPKEAQVNKNLRVNEVNEVLKGYQEKGSNFVRDQWTFSDEYNIRYGFLKFAILLGSMIHFISSTKKVKRIFNQPAKEIIKKLEDMQLENAKLWYQKSGDVDCHGMTGTIAASVLKYYLLDCETWAEIRFVFGQERHGGDHQCNGVLKRLADFIFKVEENADACPSGYMDSVKSCREKLYTVPPSFEIKYYAGGGAVQVRGLLARDPNVNGI